MLDDAATSVMTLRINYRTVCDENSLVTTLKSAMTLNYSLYAPVSNGTESTTGQRISHIDIHRTYQTSGCLTCTERGTGGWKCRRNQIESAGTIHVLPRLPRILTTPIFIQQFATYERWIKRPTWLLNLVLAVYYSVLKPLLQQQTL